jgi:integrase
MNAEVAEVRAAVWQMTDQRELSSGLVSTHVDGSALNPTTVSRTFDRLVVEAGVPRITLHGTRHTWATLGLLEGIPDTEAPKA